VQRQPHGSRSRPAGPGRRQRGGGHARGRRPAGTAPRLKIFVRCEELPRQERAHAGRHDPSPLRVAHREAIRERHRLRRPPIRSSNKHPPELSLRQRGEGGGGSAPRAAARRGGGTHHAVEQPLHVNRPWTARPRFRGRTRLDIRAAARRCARLHAPHQLCAEMVDPRPHCYRRAALARPGRVRPFVPPPAAPSAALLPSPNTYSLLRLSLRAPQSASPVACALLSSSPPCATLLLWRVAIAPRAAPAIPSRCRGRERASRDNRIDEVGRI